MSVITSSADNEKPMMSRSAVNQSTWVTAACIVATSSVVLMLRRRRVKAGSSSDDCSELIVRDDTPGRVGSRGVMGLQPPIPYLNTFFRCLQDPCDPVENPHGYIGLCIAENRIVTDLLSNRLTQPQIAKTAFYDHMVYSYNSFLGLMITREAAAYFLAKRFLYPEQKQMTAEQALKHIDPDLISIGSGAAGILNSLFYTLGEAGDAVLIPAPYYAAFEADMKVMARCVPVPLEMAHPAHGPTDRDLDIAYLKAKSKGLRVRFLLMTNPNNPLGVIYRPETVKTAITWARKRGIDTIMDEIYALSTHKKEGHGFQSVIRILNNDLGDNVHMIWALSKDFGASGFRVGILYTQNRLLLKALSTLHVFSGVSHPMQMVTAEILTDDTFLDSFLDESRNRILYSYTICATKLEEMVIPYIPAEAGLFIYADFSSLLKSKTFEGEELLRELIVNHARVVLTPGESQRDPHPGMFRICYTWVSPDVLLIAMERISRLVAKIRKMDWEDLNESSLNNILEY